MSDTQVMDEQTTEATETPAEAKPTRAKKEPVQPHPCLCSTFLVGEKNDDGSPDADAQFTTECEASTLRVFAQGHDARLVSFLVNAHFDELGIWRKDGDSLVAYTDPGHAMSGVSEPLAAKADSAMKNAKAKLDAKAEREAGREAQKAAKAAEKAAKAQEKADAKAAKDAEKAQAKAAKDAAKASQPRDVAAAVVPGSAEGDVRVDANAPVAEEQEDGTKKVLIKVGRGTYDAILSADGQTVNYRDNEGVEHDREVDTVRMLSKVA